MSTDVFSSFANAVENLKAASRFRPVELTVPNSSVYWRLKPYANENFTAKFSEAGFMLETKALTEFFPAVIGNPEESWQGEVVLQLPGMPQYDTRMAS